MIRLHLALVLPIVAALQVPPASPNDVFTYVRMLDAAGSKNVWPGFVPSEWPLALFDGENTILVRHPGPPPEFVPMPGRPGVLMAPGPHPAVTANSTRQIAGVWTGTVIATPQQNVESTLLAVVEEVFHVFWRSRHPSVRPNEMARYAYPVKDVKNLARLLAEDEALARALDATSSQDAARWAAIALQLRRDRSTGLANDVRAFELELETMEGVANYVARRSLGQTPADTARRLRNSRAADGIRWRFYDSGTALCFLLDRFDPGWQPRSDDKPEVLLAEWFGAALDRLQVTASAFSAADLAGFHRTASSAIADLSKRQERLHDELLSRPGFHVVVDVADGAEPLAVKRFDPINLFVLDAGEVVQSHFLTLAGPDGSIELTNPDFSRSSFAGTVALTRPAGRHPLADGVRHVTIVGFREAPRIDRVEDKLTLVAPGLRMELRGAVSETRGDTIRITILRASPGRR